MRGLHGLSADRKPVRSARDEDGAVLVEVIVAMLLAAVMAVGAAALSGVALRATLSARVQTSALALAEQRLEQLRALVWTGGVDGLPRRTDLTTDLSAQPVSASGRGLAPSPADALQVNRAGYADFLDADGRRVGAGTTAPAEAVFVRRWSVTPAPHDPVDAIVLRVRVTTVGNRARSTSGPILHGAGDDVLLATVKARKGA